MHPRVAAYVSHDEIFPSATHPRTHAHSRHLTRRKYLREPDSYLSPTPRLPFWLHPRANRSQPNCRLCQTLCVSWRHILLSHSPFSSVKIAIMASTSLTFMHPRNRSKSSHFSGHTEFCAMRLSLVHSESEHQVPTTLHKQP